METIEKRDAPLFPISAAAKLLGISVHTLRMYEKEGLIVPFKKASRHRLYSNSDIERLFCIRKAINESKISIAGIKSIYALIPCWDITSCSKKDKEKCEAYVSHSSPCWSFKHTENVCAGIDCRRCEAYKNFTECVSLKEKLKNIIK